MNAPDFKSLKAIQWLEPWKPIPEFENQKPETKGGVTGYDLELVREVGPKHPLFPVKSAAILIGARGDCDDRLYWIPNEQTPFVVVHLTWQGKKQQWSADHPTTTFFSSLEDWLDNGMKADHDFFKEVTAERTGEKPQQS